MFQAFPLGANVAIFLAAALGANLLNLALLFIVDAVYREGPVLILRMGIDSLLVLGTYGLGVAVLYSLRP